jgi:hypothetical protein
LVTTHRDANGWRIPGEWGVAVEFEAELTDAPMRVKAVLRFGNDLLALEALTESPHLPRVRARPSATASTGFAFVNASGAGFGQSLSLLGTEEVNVLYGLWEADTSDNSSNWREFYNQVMAVKRGLDKGTIPHRTELFLFTDNFVAERGTSKSKTLFELVLCLRNWKWWESCLSI